jgi:hypothetical protein
MGEVVWDWERKIGRGLIVGAYVLFILSLAFRPCLCLGQRATGADDRYYILRDEMLGDLTRLAGEQVRGNAPWQVSLLESLVRKKANEQDIEATLHCIRYSSEAVPLGEEVNLPILFGNDILGRLATRPISGKGEERLRLTVVCLIRTSFPLFI